MGRSDAAYFITGREKVPEKLERGFIMKKLSFFLALSLLLCVVFGVSYAESDSLIVYTSI